MSLVQYSAFFLAHWVAQILWEEGRLQQLTNYPESTWRGELGTPRLLTKSQVASHRVEKEEDIMNRPGVKPAASLCCSPPQSLSHAALGQWCDKDIEGYPSFHSPACPPLGTKLTMLCSYQLQLNA